MDTHQRRSGWIPWLMASLLALHAAGLVATSTSTVASPAETATITPEPTATITPEPTPALEVTVPTGSPFATAISVAADAVIKEQRTEGPRPTDPVEDDLATPETIVAAEPVRVVIPAIAVDAHVVPVGLHDNGALAVPDFGLAGWYELGPRPGETGPAVIAAHVDSRAGPDVFYRLAELTSGDEIEVHDSDGTVHRFTVSAVEQHSKDHLPADRIWRDDQAPVLRLITCGGTFDRSVRHYTDNVIVFAERV